MVFNIFWKNILITLKITPKKLTTIKKKKFFNCSYFKLLL